MESIEENRLSEFIENKGIGNYQPKKNSKKNHLEFSQSNFKLLCSLGIVRDATEGGLIKGLIENIKAAIYLLKPVANGKLLYIGFVNPGWYISGADSCKKHQVYFQSLESSIDNFLNSDLSNFTIPKNCKIIDTQNKPITFLLLHSANQFIFTKPTVLNHLDMIVELENNPG